MFENWPIGCTFYCNCFIHLSLCLGIVSKHIGVALEYLGAPPVWGCIGINEFVDFQHIVKYSEVYYPFSRSISLAGDSTLPKGKVKPELRFLSYLINEEDCDKINNEVQTSKVGIVL